MKLYVINLDRSRDRLEYITTAFRERGLGFERISAVDADSMSDQTYQAAAAGSQWRSPLTRGEIACFLSHRKVWEKIAEGPESFAAIFEDDASLSPGAHQVLSSCDWIPSDADIVKLETRKNRIHLGKAQKFSRSRHIARLKSTHLLSAGYIISQKAAVRLLRESEKVIMPVDHFMFNFGYSVAQTLHLYQLDPAIVMQVSFPTTIMLQDNKIKTSFTQKLKRETTRIIIDVRMWYYAAVRFTLLREKWKRIPWA